MTTTEQCSNCRFWIALTSDDDPLRPETHHRTTGYKDADGYTGLCRRSPPVSDTREEYASDAANASRWPVTFEDDWCGEHSSDERG